jgi:hypothetical protein
MPRPDVERAPESALKIKGDVKLSLSVAARSANIARSQKTLNTRIIISMIVIPLKAARTELQLRRTYE